MIRRIVFQIHWALGISAGLVLMAMALTGATMAFEAEIMRALSPGIVTIDPPAGAARLGPDALLAAIQAERPERAIATLVVASAPQESDRVLFERTPGATPMDSRSFVDPYSGHLLGHATGEDFFETVRAIHRWLLIPGANKGFGRPIVGIAALSLIYFALSGLWMRWPRRPLDWRQWFVIDLNQRGRGLYRSLHIVVGSWVLVFYLLSALTGLWWAFDWYRAGVTHLLVGAPSGVAEEREAGGSGRRQHGGDRSSDTPGLEVADVVLAPAWAAIQKAIGGSYDDIAIVLPHGKKPIEFRVLARDARHDRAFDDYRVSPEGQILKIAPYADQRLGPSVVANVLPIHEGAYFGWPGRIVMFLSTVSLPLFGITGWLLYLDRRKRKGAGAAARAAQAVSTSA